MNWLRAFSLALLAFGNTSAGEPPKPDMGVVIVSTWILSGP